jgi:lipoprotein-anchoring transpeptidase ErfK/SrfK
MTSVNSSPNAATARTHSRLAVGLAAALLVSLFVVVLSSCASSPNLRVSVANGARDVPLDSPLEITANGAMLGRVVLERIDSPAPPVEVAPRNEASARITAKLEPDAEYRLSAVAEPTSKTALPWQEPPPSVLSVERVFSTVRAPSLAEPDAEPVALRGQPVEVRFTEPLAQASVESADVETLAKIADHDAHVLRIDLRDPAPGQSYPIRVTGIVGKNGVPAAPQRVWIATPDPPRISDVNGSRPGDRVAVSSDTPVSLNWAAPVTQVKYRLGDHSSEWRGPATSHIELPLRLQQGQAELLTVEDALAAGGGWLARPQHMELSAPPPLQLEAFWPADGAANLSPNADPTFRFSEPISDRESAEEAIFFDPPPPGHFEWLAPNRVRFVPDGGFAREASISWYLRGGPDGPRGESGSFLAAPAAGVFATTKLKVIDVALGAQRLRLLEDGEQVFTAPVATGVRGAETPPGTYEVLYKMPTARFRGTNPDGSRYDIPNVHWVMAFYGDYTIHGAYWRSVFGRPGSAGCISLTDANAKIVFDWAEQGTKVVIHA